ncbi:hypothetical protein B0J17DRAFT_758573 [Rhizoctonia solani]|nr:hypothetical protein B0J17DRAFT_758573 [Rhizoctonia solani]
MRIYYQIGLSATQKACIRGLGGGRSLSSALHETLDRYRGMLRNIVFVPAHLTPAQVQDWLNSCCCPSILIAIAGPWMCVLGAIFLDRPVVQPLTDFLWVGEDRVRPFELDHIARVFHSINQARGELDNYYRANNPPSPGKSSISPFPYLTHYLGQIVHFAYRKPLCSDNPEKKTYIWRKQSTRRIPNRS